MDDSILCSAFVEKDVDDAVLSCASRLGTTRGAMYRAFLHAGLVQLRRGSCLPAMRSERVVLRTVKLCIAVDRRLSAHAIQLGIEKGELAQRLARLGMQAIRIAMETLPPGAAFLR